MLTCTFCVPGGVFYEHLRKVACETTTFQLKLNLLYYFIKLRTIVQKHLWKQQPTEALENTCLQHFKKS